MQPLENNVVSFLSPYKQFRLVMSSALPKTQFTEGRPGKYVQFESNNFSTSDPIVLEWLRAHSDYGVKFFENKDQKQSKALSPEMMELTSDINEDELKEILAKVRASKASSVVAGAPKIDAGTVKPEISADEQSAAEVAKKKIQESRVKQVTGVRSTASHPTVSNQQ